jgi:hypothetical protein
MWRRGMHIGFWWENEKKETTRKTKQRWVDLGEVGWVGMELTDSSGSG